VVGAIGDVAAGFTGAIEDFVPEPHLSLDANASYGKTMRDLPIAVYRRR